jgi:DNA-binding IclR family transcriptional regulator
MPETERRVLDVFLPGAGSGFLSTALIAVRTRMSIETVEEVLERLRSQGLVRLHESDPDAWMLVARHER